MKLFRMNNAVELLWEMIPEILGEGDVAVDATVGNGRDTVALCRLVGATGRVYGFDIQEEALERARMLLEETLPGAPCTLIRCCHAQMAETVSEPLDLVLFNLGYLPGGDKAVTTLAETTLEAMVASLRLLKPGGKLAAVLYPGHEAGAREAEVVKAWAASLDQKQYAAVSMNFINQINHPPQLLLIEKRG